MPSDMTITKVGEPRPFEYPPGNHLVGYRIELEGHGPADLNQKPETPAPQVGQSIFADLEPNKNPQFPPKVKKKQRDGGGYGGGGGGKSPEQQRSIERQVAAKVASGALFGIDRDSSKEDVQDWGKKLRWLTDEVHAAIEGKA